jgi:hypothetical protein
MSAWRSKVSLNPSRPLRAFPREGTFIDESPALTAVLQAQPRRIVARGSAQRAATYHPMRSRKWPIKFGRGGRTVEFGRGGRPQKSAKWPGHQGPPRELATGAGPFRADCHAQPSERSIRADPLAEAIKSAHPERSIRTSGQSGPSRHRGAPI